MRIAKFISHCGYCSRREAEKLIKKDRVKINSLICNNPATKVLVNDEILINNKKLKLQKNIKLWKFYKPTGVVTTSRDEKGRKTIYDILPKSLNKIISIGRLDINSEGLILFTNNGDLARYFELPKSQLKRVYKVKVQGNVQKKQLQFLSKGIKIQGIKYKPIKAKLEKKLNTNSWIFMELMEGKNREIRKICSNFGWRVNKLIRIKYGEFEIGNLKYGEIKEIKNHIYNDKNNWR